MLRHLVAGEDEQIRSTSEARRRRVSRFRTSAAQDLPAQCGKPNFSAKRLSSEEFAFRSPYSETESRSGNSETAERDDALIAMEDESAIARLMAAART